MPTEKELIDERLRKLDEIRKLGVNPYPYRYEPTATSAQIREKYASLQPEAMTNDRMRVAGRIVALRRIGKVTFMQIDDGYGRLQVYFKFDTFADSKSKENYEFLKLLDLGDFIGAEGIIFKTKTGEITIAVSDYQLLCKSIRPLPEKWHGLKDVEQRYRKRYVDLIMNPSVREVFAKRAKIIESIRQFLGKNNFLDVDTPILQPIYGGAAAKPFKSHLNALDMTVYMRISNELYLKRLLVGGFPRVYEIARDFRNEDIDRTHNPEFTQVELYQAYADYTDIMEITEDIYINAAKSIGLGIVFEYQGNKIDLKKPWKRYTMVEAIAKFGNIDVEKLNDKELFALKSKYNLEIDGELTRGKMIQVLFEELVEDKLIQPTFITHHPAESTPLCKLARDNPAFVERFEPFMCGMEIGNAYSELNDPVLQKKLLEQQAKELRSGAEEAHPYDDDFVEAMDYGMPPTGGLGLGIDRMVMLLTNQPSIRDVLFFPFMKEKLSKEAKEKK